MMTKTLVALCLVQLVAGAPAGLDAYGVTRAGGGGGCGSKCYCCSQGSGSAGSFHLCNVAPLPDCSNYGGCSSEVPMKALSIIPVGEATLTHTQQQVSKTCCAGEQKYTPQNIKYAPPSEPSSYSAPATAAVSVAKAAYRQLYESQAASGDGTKCSTSTSVEASLHRTITWDTSYNAGAIALSTETKIEGHTMSGFQLTAKGHSLMTSGKTEMFAIESPVAHPCEYTVADEQYGTVQSTSLLHSYTQRAELRFQKCSASNTMSVTLEFSTQNTDNTCSYRESPTPCADTPKMEEMVHWAPTSRSCTISGPRVKREISTMEQSELGSEIQHKSWNYEWDCKGRSIQQFERQSKYNGVSFVWEPKVMKARAGRTDKLIMGLGTQCPINVESSKQYNTSNIEWFRFAFELGPDQFRVVENGRFVCESHRDGVLVYPNQCNADYDPNHRFHDGSYDDMGCGYCYGGGRRNIDVCQNRNFGGFVTRETCQKKCDGWNNCQGYAFGCENAGRCDCFVYPKRGVLTCPSEDGENRMDFILKKSSRTDDIRTTNFCWMMSSWNQPGTCRRKAKSGAFYPLAYGDRFSITINDQDHIEYKQNGFLVYKSRYTAAYYLSRGSGPNRRLAEAGKAAATYTGQTVAVAGKAAATYTGNSQASSQTVESYSDSAADLAMCSSSGYDSQNPKFFAVFSLLQGNDGELHGWRVQDAFFTERDQLRPINLHLDAVSEKENSHSSRNTAGTVITASCVAVATAFVVTGLVIFVKRSRVGAPESVESSTKAPVLASGLASI